MATTCYIGMGSNLGDRQAALDKAVAALHEHERIAVRQVSSYYETDPVGGPPDAPLFLNAAVEIETDLEPRELLDVLLAIERQLGRVRRKRTRRGRSISICCFTATPSKTIRT